MYSGLTSVPSKCNNSREFWAEFDPLKENSEDKILFLLRIKLSSATHVCVCRCTYTNLFLREVRTDVCTHLLYSVRGLERSELGGSHGCPGRLWDQIFMTGPRTDLS